VYVAAESKSAERSEGETKLVDKVVPTIPRNPQELLGTVQRKTTGAENFRNRVFHIGCAGTAPNHFPRTEKKKKKQRGTTVRRRGKGCPEKFGWRESGFSGGARALTIRPTNQKTR